MNRATVGRKRARRTLLALVCVAAAACSPIIRNYGYVPAEDQLAEIQVGRDTTTTVAEKVGRPHQEGLGEPPAWYYVSSTQRTFGPRKPQTISRDIVAIRFAAGGTVENIERFDVTDGEIVRLTARVTDDAVSEVGLLRQVFGNVGGPSADQLLGGQ